MFDMRITLLITQALQTGEKKPRFVAKVWMENLEYNSKQLTEMKAY